MTDGPGVRADLALDAASVVLDVEEGRPAPASRATSAQPGTRLVREWQGRTHTVLVTDTGFEYAGKHYPSLSAIARAITGTRWSGPAFFGLRPRRPR